MINTKCKSFKVGVRTKSGGVSITYNGLRFDRIEHAQAYARNLAIRWTEVTMTFIHLSDDEPNASYPVPSDRFIVEGRKE